jgi:DNA-binding GntR family transcriptional regulator
MVISSAVPVTGNIYAGARVAESDANGSDWDDIRIPPRRFGYDQVYRQLRRALVTRRISPGERLLENDLAAKLGVSRTPVREALRKLETEGFVTRADRGGGLQASVISAAEVEDLFLVRGSLDKIAARLATERTSSQDWVPVREQARLLQLAAVSHGVESETFNDLHLALHATIYAMAFGHGFAGLLTAKVLQHLEVAAEMSYAKPAVTSPPGDQHALLVDALASGDVERAVRSAVEHVSRSAQDAESAALDDDLADELPKPAWSDRSDPAG